MEALEKGSQRPDVAQSPPCCTRRKRRCAVPVALAQASHALPDQVAWPFLGRALWSAMSGGCLQTAVKRDEMRLEYNMRRQCDPRRTAGTQ